MRNISNGDDRNRKVAYGVALMLLLPILLMVVGDRLSRSATTAQRRATLIQSVVADEATTGDASRTSLGEIVYAGETVTAEEAKLTVAIGDTIAGRTTTANGIE